MEPLSLDEVAALEPASRSGGAWFFPENWFLYDPDALLCALAAGSVSHDSAVVRDAVAVALCGTTDGGTAMVLGGDTNLLADEVVVANGSPHSASFTRSRWSTVTMWASSGGAASC
mmetsp:Transcript_24819/g.49382  ORF Transcript_24819/g.49382 Transcript_24819/m.49382 type:complete len:116 (+) Transcript_24819:96-443(+)